MSPLIVPMLSFLAPQWLWLLLAVPVLIGLYLGLLRRKANRNRQVGRTMLDLVIPREANWRRHLAVALSLASLVSLTLAIARPKATVEVPRERATVVVTIDVSNSMAATDVEPSRLEAAKTAAQAFVQSLPPKYNVAVVAFDGTASVLLPPTLDRPAALAAIQSMELGPSTAIGDGIFASLAALAQAPADPGNPQSKPPGRIVLLSDGKTQVGRSAADGARAAKAQDVPIYTIAYGTPDGYIEVQGQREPVPVDRAELANVARISGGKAYTAQSAGQLRDVYKDIGSSVGKDKVDREVSSRYAGFGLGFAVLAALGLISLGARWP
ncbi:Ca-activated chloride channel family protein [Friedmanniella endophytica]|uniref:Ca-activated chloride channel family protein n=1 Tax=Microlunatus kandeliicorticis TaxID=1759536 RepID=A0A7W3P793_9ACTN|nr:VWA domain-containing protein [Microlunatus kandeliicorticis]MBA8795778.1 Ca-activated chloride channel family protein [Microlunatus kandeliicorticis]